jgi:hypothetical protein
MQRTVDGGVVISCDFCGADWDQVRPMIEGHHGSVLCLPCLERALQEAKPANADFRCSLGLTDEDAGTLAWGPPPTPGEPPAAGRNPHAVACGDCIQQAARGFSRDPDVPFKWDRSAGVFARDRTKARDDR